MIWVIGGGPRSYQICQYLNRLKKDYKLTTITDYKRDMPLSYTSKALSKPPSEIEIGQFIEKENIQYLIDHSYGNGSRFSKQLMKVCEEKAIAYIRYEEKTLIDEVSAVYENAKVILDIEEVKEALKGYERPIFLDVNRKVQKELACLELKNSIYKEERGTISIAQLQKNFEQHQITQVLVGESENLSTYIEVCKALQIPLIIIKRNRVNYKNRCYSLDTLKECLH